MATQPTTTRQRAYEAALADLRGGLHNQRQLVADRANDNSRPQPCTWTAIIVGMRSISAQCERVAWAARSKGWTAREFADRMLACGEAEGLI